VYQQLEGTPVDFASQSPFSSGEVFHILAVSAFFLLMPILTVSQSPFSSGEVFHFANLVFGFILGLSQSPFSSGEVFHSNRASAPGGFVYCGNWSQSPFSSGEVFHSSILNNLAENTKPEEKMQW